MADAPRVSVVMSVYNGARYLQQSVNSILHQSFRDFEFIIINDKSTDNTSDILHAYDDQRIRIIDNEENIGLTASLNKGLQECRGAYIARMDADDYSLPQRLQSQVAFLDAHPKVGLCSGWRIEDNGKKQRPFMPPCDDEQIRVELLLEGNVLGHPAVMLRKNVLEEHSLSYDEHFSSSQDYDLWVRMSAFTRLAILPEFLIIYRIHNDTVTTKSGVKQAENKDKVYLKQAVALLGDAFDDTLFLAFVNKQIRFDKRNFGAVIRLCKKIIVTNAKVKVYNQQVLSDKISEVLLYNFHNQVHNRALVLLLFLTSRLPFMRIKHRLLIIARLVKPGLITN